MMKSCFRRICCRKKYPEVYVLKLENDKYYVGESYDKKKRINVHGNGMGSAWTSKHKLVDELIPISNPQEKYWELLETISMMYYYGVDNVRGSLFSTPLELTGNEKTMAAQLYCELNGLCRKCGGTGHFISRCNNNYMAEWVSNFGGNLVFLNDKKRLCEECGFNLYNSPKYQKYCKKCYFKNFNKNNMID